MQRGLALAMAAGFWLAAAPAARGATDTLDQSQTLANTSVAANNSQMLAQTFTAGMTGRIDRLTLFVGQDFATGGGVIQIQSVAAGQPSGTSLGATTYSGFLPTTWRDFTLSASVSVVSGGQYAIVVIPNASSGNTSWGASKTVNYPGGQLWFGTQATRTWTYATTMGLDFAFETWVATGLNQAPVVTAASSTVSAGEGSLVSNSGSYSDPDGDNVSLTASAGALTKTGTSSGTWSWTQAAADEGAFQTITITANDGNGATAATTFTTSVTGLAPTATIAGAPATSLEGSTVSLTGGATSPSATDTAAGFTYSWTVTKNGGAYSSGGSATYSFQPNDEGVYVVILKATDDGGFSGTASATINGANVVPIATIVSVSPSTALLPNESVTFAGHFSDPGAADSHTVTWTFGDGSTNTTAFAAGGAADLTISHAYAKAGTYRVGLDVVDDDGGASHAASTVVVGSMAPAIAGIYDLVQDLPGLSRFQKNNLLRRLDSARRWLQRGNVEAACDQLDAFLRRVETLQDERHLSPADAAALSAATRTVEQSLGCASILDVHES